MSLRTAWGVLALIFLAIAGGLWTYLVCRSRDADQDAWLHLGAYFCMAFAFGCGTAALS